MRDEATPRVFRMRWWTPDPHPCLGGCGTILETRKAKRCPKCNRAHIGEKNKARYRERRERGVCVDCGRVPAVQRGGRCERHRERHLEHKRKSDAKKRRKDRKFVDCEICGIKIRKNGNVKYCRPCSVGDQKFVNCEICGIKIKKITQTKYCRPCSVGAWHDRIYNERKREGLCTECGRVPKGKTLRCEKCRLDQKLKNLRREIRK